MSDLYYRRSVLIESRKPSTTPTLDGSFLLFVAQTDAPLPGVWQITDYFIIQTASLF